MKSTKPCPQCHGMRHFIAHGHDHDHATAQMCSACTCPRCDGELYEFKRHHDGWTFSTPCPECTPIRDRVRLFNHARIPRRYLYGTFSNYTPNTASQRAALHWFTERMGNWEPNERALVLSGPVGTGKTHLMAAWLRTLCLHRGIAGQFVEFSHLLSEIRAGYDANRSDAAITAGLTEVPVLVIDELGKMLKTDWQQSILDSLISRRYERGLATFATTNYPFEPNIGGHATSDEFSRRTLADVTGERIASRLSEMCDFMTITAPDFRRRDGQRTALVASNHGGRR